MARSTTWPVEGEWYLDDPLATKARHCLGIVNGIVGYCDYPDRSGLSAYGRCTVGEWRHWVAESGARPNIRNRPIPVESQVWKGRRSARVVKFATETKVTFTTDAVPCTPQRTQRATFARWADAQDAMPVDDMINATPKGQTP